MNRGALRVIVAFFVLANLCVYSRLSLLAQTEDSQFPSGRILHVDRKKGFVIIDLGKRDGLKEGCFFEVYHRDTKVAEIKTIKVRSRFSAADIEYTYKNRLIKVGDALRASKKTAVVLRHKQMGSLHEELDKLFKQAQEYFEESRYELAEEKLDEILALDPESGRALQMLTKVRQASVREEVNSLFSYAQGLFDEMEYELAEEKLDEILALDPENEEAWKMLRKIKQCLQATAGLKPETIAIDINAPKQIVLATALDVFKKYGYLITFSDPVKFNLQASKDIEASFTKKMANEWGPYTRNKVYYTVEIKELPKSEYLIVNRLVIYLKEACYKEGRSYYSEIKKDSSNYQEAREIAFAIKEVAEEL